MFANTILLIGLLNSQNQPDTTLPAPRVVKRDTVSADSVKTFVRSQSKEPEAYMTQQVTYVSEFIKRFNNQVSADGKPVPDSLQNTAARKQVVEQLFDRFSSAVVSKHSFLNTHREQFLDQVCDESHPIRLKFLSNDLYASLPVQVTYQEKEQLISFYLKSVSEGQGHSWKILDAQAPFLTGQHPAGKLKGSDKTAGGRAAKDTSGQTTFIPLNAQETAFLNLFNHIRDKDDLRQLTIQTEEPTVTVSALSKLVSEGHITPVHTDYPIIYLPMENGWVLKLTFTNRKHENSGWLISDLYQIPGSDIKQLPPVFLPYMTNPK